MTRDLLRTTMVGCSLVLLTLAGGCLGGSTEPSPDVRGETSSGPVPPEAFHQTPREGTYEPFDYEDILFEGRIILKSTPVDYSPFRATWIDLGTGVDLCLAYVLQGPSCRINPAGEVSLSYPREGVPLLTSGAHRMTFRVYWGDADPEAGDYGTYVDDEFTLNISTDPRPSDTAVYLDWSPSAGDAPITSDTVRLVIDEGRLANQGTTDILAWDIEWFREPELGTPRRYEAVAGCPVQGEAPVACRLTKDDMCVGETWWVVATRRNAQGEAADPITTDEITIGNTDPFCQKMEPTDASVCRIGISPGPISAQGARAKFRCEIDCADQDNEAGACDEQSIHYRFDWVQSGVSATPIATELTVDEGAAVLQGRAHDDPEALGTELAKGELKCNVYAENAAVADTSGLTAYTCKIRIANLQPKLERSCVQAFNANFPDTFDQNTVYTCAPDLATLTDPDDDESDPSLFSYDYEWQRTPLGGTPQDIEMANWVLPTYPYHCDPDNPESGLARGDTLCCNAIPRNPDANSATGTGTGQFGQGEGCCVTIGNTPPFFRVAPEMVAVTIENGTTRTTATELTTIQCRVPDNSFFDCDGDRAGDFRFQWSVQPPSGGEYTLFPGGDEFLPTGAIGPENFNKGDKICCSAVPYDSMDIGLPKRTAQCISVVNTAPRVTSLKVQPGSGPKSEPFECVAEWVDPDPQDNLPGRVEERYSFIIENAAGGRMVVDDVNRDGLLNPSEPPNGLAQGDRIHCCLVLDDHEATSPVACSDADFNQTPAIVNDGLARIDGVNLTATPEPATVLSTLQCRPYGWLDAEQDPEGYRFYWYVNSSLKLRDPSGPGARLSSTLTAPGNFVKGDVVTCRVVTYDGTNVSGNPQDVANPGLIWSASVTIEDACWDVAQLTVTPSEGRNDPDTTYRCEIMGFTDPDAEDQAHPPTLTYRWYQTSDPHQDLGSPVLGPGGLELASQNITGEGLVPNTNDRLYCAVLHSCAGAGDVIVSANGAQVLNTCPSVGDVRITFTNSNPDGRPLVGDVVTCAPDGWDDAEGEAPRYKYEWRLNSATLPGETQAQLTVTPAMAHKTLVCAAAPIDSYHEDCSLEVSEPLIVDNTPPRIQTVLYQPGVIYTDTDVVCIPDGWQDVDGDRPGYSFQWFVDGAPVASDLVRRTTFDGDTLDSEAFEKGDRVLCRATPYDGFDNGPTVPDVQLTVRNTLPTIEVSFRYPTPNPERGENLVCQFTATDPDLGDPIVGDFRWYRNGQLQNLTSTSDLDDDDQVFELDITQFEPCDRFTCEVIPSDGEFGLAKQAEAQYWGGAALSFEAPTSVVRAPVANLQTAEGTVDWWFRLESPAGGTERTLFAHKPTGAPNDHVSVVLAADGSPGLRLGSTQVASLGTVLPTGQWTYFALQWSAGSWELFAHVRAVGGTTGTWYKVTKAGVELSAWVPSALRFGAGSLQESSPLGVFDEVRFSSVRRWDPARGVAFAGGVPVEAPRAFWLPLQGDADTLALYHITSDGWPAAGENPPITDWTPGGTTPATADACKWTRLSQVNECQYLVNVPPPPPAVALRIDGITTTPTVPVNPGYFMHYRLGCDLTEPSYDFNGDAVGYVFRLFQDGIEREAVTLGAEDVAAGETGVAFSATVTINSATPCPVVACSVEAFDGELYSEPGEDQQIAGYANLEDYTGALNRSFAGLGFGCDLGNLCLTDACIDAQGGCVFNPRPGPCNDGDACTAGDQCVSGVCRGEDLCEDDNQCTTHTCTVVAGQGVCHYENLAAPCNDGNVCTVNDVCIDGLCVPGYQQNCNDNRTCTRDRCDATLGCVNDAEIMNGTRCENANLCTFDSTCQGGACLGGTPVNTEDGNQCTIDGCDPDSGVYHTPKVGDPCVLTDPCVVEETCQLVGATVACVGAAKDCNDGNPCTADGCDPSIQDGCYHLPNTATCNDSDPCTLNDYCSGGTCQPGTTPLTCNDNNPCTTDICQYQVGCRFNYNTDACNDRNACTQDDRCQVGICAGAPISCNDNNDCTLDYCDSAQGCLHLNTTNACNDRNACTTNDICAAGVCSGAAIVCNDNNPCTTDTCDGNVGCVFTNNDNNQCSDGNPCTVGDRCVNGACAAGLPRDCNDNNVCTFDTCGASGACEHINQPGACEDGDLCTVGDQCSGGTCRAGTAKNCDDSEFCTIDTCVTTTGLCAYANKPPDTACDDSNACTQGDKCIVPSGQTLMVCTPGTPRNCNDNNVCTLDACDAAGNCTHVNQDNITCDDANACTLNDRCIDGTCRGAAEAVCNDNNPCTTDSCSPTTGCVNSPVAVGTTCSDGNPCTSADTCKLQGGVLTCSGNTLNCDDGNACTADFCGGTGTCQHTNLTGSCSDNNACTTGDTCTNGYCVGGPPATCNDNNSCTADTCNPAGDPAAPCVFTARPAGTTCTDGDPCTLSDKCALVGTAMLCQGTPNSCDDNNVCTTDVCQADGSCGHSNLSAIPCSDNNSCTTGDACQAGACVGGAAPNCDDGNSCTIDTCEGTVPGGCVHVNQANNSLCNDGNICTDNDRCSSGGGGTMTCGGTAVSCNDNNPCTQDSCNPASGCTYANAPNGQACNDSNACTSGTVCTAGVCGGGTTTTCNDEKECTTDTCDPATGTCLYTARPNGTACSDNNVCTTGDRCVTGNCTPVGPATNGTPCSDANACTVTDTCTNGTCTGAGAPNCADTNPCTQDICIPETGCSHPSEVDGTTCNDNDACTNGTTCTAGICAGGTTLTCNDGLQCTSDACVPATGCVYTNLASTEACSDGSACTSGDHCDGDGICLPGTEICDVCVDTATFSCGGATDMSLAGDSGAGPSSIASYSGGTCSTSTFAGREATYAITDTDGSAIEVFWTTATGGALAAGYSVRALKHVNGCNPTACQSDALGGTLRFSTTAVDDYYTVLDHTTVGTGTTYRVHARCVDKASCAATLGCDGATRCTMDGQANQLGGSGARYGVSPTWACTGGVAQDFDGYDRIFKFVYAAATNGDVQVYLTDATGAAPEPDYFAFVLQAGPETNPPIDCGDILPNTCIASSYDTGTGNPKQVFRFPASVGNVYCIAVDSKSLTMTEQFVLSVGCF